jgi:hypothetical protein
VPARASVKKEGWRCPECGRRFRQRTREHSCAVVTVAAHLERASSEVKQTFAALQDSLAHIGPHAIVPVKTMILLRATANFAGIVVRKECLHLEFVLERPVEHSRIHKRQQYGPRKYTHHVRLTSPADVDERLLSWVRESYQAVAQG